MFRYVLQIEVTPSFKAYNGLATFAVTKPFNLCLRPTPLKYAAPTSLLGRMRIF